MENTSRHRTVLVVGGDSALGSALSPRLIERGHKLLRTSRRIATPQGYLHVDLSQNDSRYVFPEGVEVAFICAAENSVERCRTDPDATRIVNVLQTEAVARALVNTGARVVFLSTNHVFDGSKPNRRTDEPVLPCSEYGRQKAEAEQRLLRMSENVTIVRLTKVLSRNVPLINDWIRSLESGRPIHPFSDVFHPPLPLQFVVEVLSRLADTPYSGILQLSGAEDVSYEKLARSIAAHLGANPALVQPISSEQGGYYQVEGRPQYLTLDAGIVRQLFKLDPPTLDDVVDAILKEPVPALTP